MTQGLAEKSAPVMSMMCFKSFITMMSVIEECRNSSAMSVMSDCDECDEFQVSSSGSADV